MTLQELIRRFRVLAKDQIEPYFWEDEDVTDWLNDAEQEAAIRGRLIREYGNPAVCIIAVVAGTASYPLHESVFEITRVSDADGCGLPIRTPEWLDRNMMGWREDTGCPKAVIQDDTFIRVVPVPDQDTAVTIECYRLPLVAMADPENDSPEIHGAHHVHLIDWALHKAFSIPDTEAFDPSRSAQALERFEQYFGLRPDSDLRRSTRNDDPHHIVPFLV